MPWRPLHRIAFAVCVYPFQPSAPADLPLQIGDELYIIEQGGFDGSWYRGYLVAPPSLLAGLTSVKGQTLEARVFSGIFPRSCVQIRELLGDVTPGDDARGIGEHGDVQSNNTPSQSAPSERRLTTRGLHSDRMSSAGRRVRGTSWMTGRSSRSDGKRSLHPSSARSTHSLESQPEGLAQSSNPEDAGSAHVLKPPAPVPLLKVGDETPTSAEEPLVDEIASCLREWYSTKLHELLLSRQYTLLDELASLVQRLDDSRRRILHKVLTAQELNTLRETTIWDLVRGNKLCSGEVVVRSSSERGRILTGDDSPVEMTRLQAMMSLLDQELRRPPEVNALFHLLVGVRDFVGEIKQPTTLTMYLCSKAPDSPPQPVSEVYAIDIFSADISNPSIIEKRFRTLFTDLSSVDVGEDPGFRHSLYLVFKLLTNEPVRPPSSFMPTTGGRDSSVGPERVETGSFDLPLGGRRSVMWGPKGRRVSDDALKVLEQRPTTGSTVTSVTKSEGRPPSAAAKLSTNKIPVLGEPKAVKRFVGVGVLELNAFLRKRQSVEQEVKMWTPATTLEEEGNDDGGHKVTILGELMASPTGDYKSSGLVNRFNVSITPFAHPDAEELVKRTPTLLYEVLRTPKIGFSGAPTRPRSDIYITISELLLPRNGFLTHPRVGSVPIPHEEMANVQLTLEVRTASGSRIEKCIYPSANSAGHTAWRTTAVYKGEAWNQTIKLVISPDDVPGSHIIMSVADAPNFPFALCWIPLWSEDAFIRNGDHSLALHKYDEYTSSIVAGRGAYLGLSWKSSTKDESVIGPMAALRLRTFLCSTKYSQDPNLLGLLNWQDQEPNDLIALLRRFVFVPEIEIVKLLDDVFNALFDILIDHSGHRDFEDLVFSSLVTVLGIVNDRRFNLHPLVDDYANNRFRYPFAVQCLLKSFNRLLADPTNSESSRTLRSTFKVGRHIFGFIIRARQQQKEKEAGIGITSRQSTFNKDLQVIFKGLEALIRHPAPQLVGTKTLAVQNFHSWLPELVKLMRPADILQIAFSFVDACVDVHGRLILYKLVLILNLARLEIFKSSELRQVLVNKTMRWLSPYWGKPPIVSGQWRDQVRLCCSVLAAQIDDLGSQGGSYTQKIIASFRAVQAMPRTRKTSLSLLFPTAYPFSVRPISTTDDFDESLLELSAILAATSDQPISVPAGMSNETFAEFLLDSLQVYQSVLDCGAFPCSWLSLLIYHYKSTEKYLERIYLVLSETFLPHPDQADEFNTELWRSFFDTLLKLVSNEALALETFPEQKRRAVWKIAGDVRELGAELLQRSWEVIGWETSSEDRARYGVERMGGYQVQYVPGLVAPIVELCLSVHEGLRSVAIDVLHSMIISDWTLSQDLTVIQAEMIDCLDRMFKTKNLTESILQKLFIGELIESFELLANMPDDPLYTAVKNLIDTIDELLDLLVAVHNTEAAGGAFHILDTLRLMDFLKDMQKEDIYIRYVHQLAEVQADSGNYTEAGLALRLHAELYSWDPTTIVEPLADPFLPAQTSFARKESIYFEMVKQYEEGQSWDNALGTYLELAQQYEHNIFDFAKLSRTQRAMATIYESIGKGERQNPRYFRVVYKGLGFPPGLRDKQFIFEGSASDRLATFTDRMQQQHPSAQIISGGSAPSVEGQFLQIFPVSPQKDLLHPVHQRTRVAQPVRDFYLLSRPSHFATTTRKQVSLAGVKDQVAEKTVYTTSEPFPTILRRSEIITAETVRLTPMETGIERTTRKTAELISLEKQLSESDDPDLRPLTDALIASVDPDVEASVSRYHELIAVADPKEDGTVEEPPFDALENALKVALVDHALVVKRCIGRYSGEALAATKADLIRRFEVTFAPELATLSSLSQHPSHIRDASHTSWTPHASPIPSPIQSPVRSPEPQRPSEEDRIIQTVPIGHTTEPELRPTRKDKNRLSLTFLKRASITSAPRDHTASPTRLNGGRGGYQPRRSHSRTRSNSAHDHHHHGGAESDTGDTTPTERPASSFSERMGMAVGMAGMRRRFSKFQLGKKESKSSVKSPVESVVEE